MSPKEFAKLLEYITENNCWGEKAYEITIERKRKAVKYVNAIFDSRDGKVYRIVCTQVLNNDSDTKEFTIESPEDIDRIYAWLDDPVADFNYDRKDNE